MRQKRFRLWSVDEHLMRDDFLVDSEGLVYLDIPGLPGPLEPEKYILMEYAGINDKNGNPVFEGDIFEAPHDFGPAGFEKRIAVCGWKEGGQDYQWEYWLLEQLEVIGNKFENPDMCENICSYGGFHEWGTDGAHSNEFCKKCFKNKPEGAVQYERTCTAS